MVVIEFIRQFITNPFGSFVIGISIMYGIIIYLDSVSRKEMEQEKGDESSGIAELAGQVEELNAVMDEQDETIRTLEGQVEDLESECEETAQFHEGILKKQDEEKADLEEALAVLQQDEEEIQWENTALSDKLEAIQSEKKDFEQQVADLSGELEKMRDEHEGSREQMHKQMQNLEEKNASLKAELSECPEEEEVQLIEKEKSKLSVQLFESKQKYAQLEGLLGHYRGKETISEPPGKSRDPVVKTLYQENKKLYEKIEEYLNTIGSLEVDVRKLEKLREKNLHLDKEVEEAVNKETSVLQEKLKRLEEQLAAAEEHEESESTQTEQIEKLQQVIIKQDIEMELLKERIETTKRETTSSEDSVLSNDDLIAEIEQPQVPKIEETPHIVAERLYNIFLPKLATEDKKNKAVPLLQEITGLSETEAEELSTRTVIPVAKGVDRQKADKIKERFIEVGILPRIKRQR